MYWRDMFPHFSRKEIVKLQLSSRFLNNAVEKVKPAPLHIIENLFIKKFDGSVKFGVRKRNRIRTITFAPPDYVRFSEVVMIELAMIDADFLHLLKTHQIVFSGCKLWLMPTTTDEEQTNKALKIMMEDVFTECQEIMINFKGWTCAHQLNICSLSGVSKCDNVRLNGEEMVLNAEDPLFQSIFEWLHSNTGNGKKYLMLRKFSGCELLLRKLMRRFADDMEPHYYELTMELNDNFLDEFLGESATNSRTQEKSIVDAFFDGEVSVFYLGRIPLKCEENKA